MYSTRPVALGALLLIACGGEGDPTATPTAAPTATPAAEVVDLRFEIPAVPESGFQYVLPEFSVKPYTEVEMCWFVTYDGPDLGITKATNYQAHGFGHHLIIMEISDPEGSGFEEGKMFDCTDPESMPMESTGPLVIPNRLYDDGSQAMELPEGMAVRLKSGTLAVMQSHYVNTTENELLVRDVYNFEGVGFDQVETWAAPFVHILDNFSIQPSSSLRQSVTCRADMDMHLLSLAGHLHEWGTSYLVEHNQLDGTVRELYSVPVWDPGFRDKPPMIDYAPGEFTLKAGESLTSYCEWFNDEDYALEFPKEMCATSGLFYESKVMILCDGD